MANTHSRAQGRRWAWLGAPLLAGMLTTCGPGHGTDCLKSNGKTTTQRRAVPKGLAEVFMLDNVDLYLVQDTATYAEVRAGENVIDDIEFDFQDSLLRISNTSKCNWARSYDTPREVTLHLPRITSVYLHGVGNISTRGRFRQNVMFFHMTGAGNYDLDLEAQRLYIDQFELGDATVRGTVGEVHSILGGNGRFFGQGLQTQDFYYESTRFGDGDAHVRATNFLYARAEGTGTLYYGGAPARTDIVLKGSGTAKAE